MTSSRNCRQDGRQKFCLKSSHLREDKLKSHPAVVGDEHNRSLRRRDICDETPKTCADFFPCICIFHVTRTNAVHVVGRFFRFPGPQARVISPNRRFYVRKKRATFRGCAYLNDFVWISGPRFRFTKKPAVTVSVFTETSVG